jgi:hypothetical protein
MGTSTGVQDSYGTRNQRFGCNLRQGRARVNAGDEDASEKALYGSIIDEQSAVSGQQSENAELIIWA